MWEPPKTLISLRKIDNEEKNTKTTKLDYIFLRKT